jgi:mono/diheme cytochrome c family protein
VGLTIQAYTQLHPNATPANSLYGHFTAAGEQDLDPTQVAKGKDAFIDKCGNCHKAYRDAEGTMGPDLTGEGLRSFLGEIEGHPDVRHLSFYERWTKYVRGDIRPPRSAMPKYTEQMLSSEELDAIGAYVSQDPDEVRIPASEK